jgi:hypothetical protein
VGGIALDCLRGLLASVRAVDGTMGLGMWLLEGGVDEGYSRGKVRCRRKEGLREAFDAARRPGKEAR